MLLGKREREKRYDLGKRERLGEEARHILRHKAIRLSDFFFKKKY
jgi:hypothetical protein